MTNGREHEHKWRLAETQCALSVRTCASGASTLAVVHLRDGQVCENRGADAEPLLTGCVVDAALRSMGQVEEGKTNPFLHLSMHLSITEQCSIDQPRGIRQAVELLTHRLDSLHEAHHAAMDCLGQMLWESQRAGRPPDGQSYVACVQRHATRD